MTQGNEGSLGRLSRLVALLGLLGALVLYFLPSVMTVEAPAQMIRYASYVAMAAGGLAVVLGLAGRGSPGAGAGTGLGALLLAAGVAYSVLTFGAVVETPPPAPAAGSNP